jgi:hypothetical protein
MRRRTRPPWSLRRRRFFVLGLPAGFAVSACALVGLGVSGSLQGFSANITNSSGSYAAGTLLLSETQGANTCISTGTNTTASDTVSSTDSNTGCTSINLLGGQAAADPGIAASTTSVVVKNIGTINASTGLTLTPGGCSASSNSATSPYAGADTAGYCGKVDVTISNGSTCVYPSSGSACPVPSSTYTLATLGATARSLGALAAGAQITYTFTLALDSTATNADQGLSATDSFAWNLAQ